MPSSSDAVATTARSSPFFRRVSASWRSVRDRLPWCGRTTLGPRRSAERVRDAFRQTARIDEDERGALAEDVAGQAIVDFLPHLAGGDRAEFVVGDLDGEVHLAAVSDVDDARYRARDMRPPPRWAAPWRKGRSVADACERWRSGEPASAPDASRACRPRRHGSHRRSTVRTVRSISPRSLRGQQNEQGLRRRDQNVRRLLAHSLAIRGRCVAGANRGPDGRQRHATRAPRVRRSQRAGVRDSAGRRSRGPSAGET